MAVCSVLKFFIKALLRYSKIEVPRIHDVGEILVQEVDKLPSEVQIHAKKLAAISKNLRRDRELAFYGAEDLTPMEFYKEEDASLALKDARWVFSVCKEGIES